MQARAIHCVCFKQLCLWWIVKILGLRAYESTYSKLKIQITNIFTRNLYGVSFIQEIQENIAMTDHVSLGNKIH